MKILSSCRPYCVSQWINGYAAYLVHKLVFNTTFMVQMILLNVYLNRENRIVLEEIGRSLITNMMNLHLKLTNKYSFFR